MARKVLNSPLTFVVLLAALGLTLWLTLRTGEPPLLTDLGQCPASGILTNAAAPELPLAPIDAAAPDGQGAGVLFECRRELRGDRVQDLTSAPSFPSRPSERSRISNLELSKRFGDFYGVHLRGWIHPPATGQYRFWIVADDDAQLWLSPDDTPEAKVRTCYTPEFTAPQEWTKRPEQTSRSVPLIAGRRYYIEVLMKQGAGGECLAVAWEGPTLKQQVTQANYLSPFPAPAN